METEPTSKSPSVVLVVDDSPHTLEVLQRNLASQGYRVITATNVDDAVLVLGKTTVDLVITDLKLPRISGIDLVRHVQDNLPDTVIMMITGYATVDSAVEALKAGAEEYLAKPFTDEELTDAVGRALAKQGRRRLMRTAGGDRTRSRHSMVGESAAMKRLFHVIDKTASSSATVLIVGESGVGKELVARAIHYAGPRASAPFVPVNCGAIPDQLVESELFGHAKGAFTGAMDSRDGFFKAAHGGSIFLDEISELSPRTQVKLLRVLQSGEITPIGSSQPRSVDVRILAATNKDLETLVRNGKFREDLFFRVSVINIEVPPLRDRDDDVLLLTRHLTRKYAKLAGSSVPAFSDEALTALKNYPWPGNVRELENTLNRLIVMGNDETINVSDLPPAMRFAVKPNGTATRTLAEIEFEHIQTVLANVRGNKTRAAKILGIDRKTLRERLKSH